MVPTRQRSVHGGDVAVAFHVAPVRFGVVRMVAAVDVVLVRVEAVRGVQRDPAACLLLVHLLGEAGDKETNHRQ